MVMEIFLCMVHFKYTNNIQIKSRSTKEIQPWNAKRRLSDTKDTSVITCKIQLPTAGLHPGWVCEGGVNDTANTLSHSIISESH